MNTRKRLRRVHRYGQKTASEAGRKEHGPLHPIRLKGRDTARGNPFFVHKSVRL